MKHFRDESLITKEEVLNFLRKNKHYFEQEFGVTRIALFGSYARDEQKPSSDIDLLIETKNYDFRTRMRLKHFIEEALNKRVDIGYYDSVRLAVKKNIQKDLIYA